MKLKRRGLLLVGLLASVAWSVGILGAQDKVDFVLHNGKVLTVDTAFTIAQAVAVAGNRIKAVGSDADVMKLAGPDTTVIDLKGRTLMPGLVDTHSHIHQYAESAYGGALTPEQRRRFPISWKDVKAKEEILSQIKDTLEKYKLPKNEWVYFENKISFMGGGGSADQATILYDQINRWELDKVAPDTPIALSLGIPDFNGVLVNGKAMDILMKQYGKVIEQYGRYWIDGSGRPDGHLEPPASRIVPKFLPRPSPAVLAPLYKKYLDELASMGVTSVSTRLPSEGVEAFKRLNAAGELTVRLGFGMEEEFGTVSDMKDGLKKYRGVVGSGDDNIWVTSISPSAVDGASTRACTSQTRATAYGAIDRWWPAGQCHMDLEFSGARGKAARIKGNYFKDWVFATAREGIRFANTHVAGDRSVSMLLDSVEQLQKQMGPAATKGWAFDHCTLVDPKDFPRAARLGISFSCAPKYIESVAPDANKVYSPKVANTFVVPAKSMLDAGIRVVFETDRDVYTWHDISLLITRKDPNGNVWGPQERLDRVRTLRMVTNWAAEYLLKGDVIGSLEPGKLADLIVLDKDFMTVNDDEIETIHPMLTMLNGKVVYLYPTFANEQKLQAPGAVMATYMDLLMRRTNKGRSDF